MQKVIWNLDEPKSLEEKIEQLEKRVEELEMKLNLRDVEFIAKFKETLTKTLRSDTEIRRALNLV